MPESRKLDLEAAARLMQHVVTEHGAVDLSVLGDDERPLALIELAHPDFRDSLRASLA